MLPESHYPIAPNLRPGRDYLPGTARPYRPCPPDFRDVYIRLGWDRALEEYYRTNWRVIRRWIDESGGDELRRARFEVAGAKVGGKLRPERRSKLPTYAQAIAQGEPANASR